MLESASSRMLIFYRTRPRLAEAEYALGSIMPFESASIYAIAIVLAGVARL